MAKFLFLIVRGLALVIQMKGCCIVLWRLFGVPYARLFNLLLELGANVNNPKNSCRWMQPQSMEQHEMVVIMWLCCLLKPPDTDVMGDGTSLLCMAILSANMTGLRCLIDSGARMDCLALDYANADGTTD